MGITRIYLKLRKILLINPKINIHKSKYVPVNLDKFQLKNKYIAFSELEIIKLLLK